MEVKEYMFETKHLGIRKFESKDAQRLYENHLEEKEMKLKLDMEFVKNIVEKVMQPNC